MRSEPTQTSGTALSMLELERIAARGWQGTSAEWLGEWLLRAGGGFTGRANSTLVLGPPGVPMPQAVSMVETFYRRHGLPALFQVPFEVGRPDAATDTLVAAGWRPFNRTAVMTASLTAAAVAFPGRSMGQAVFEDAPSAEWLAGYHYRGRPLPADAVRVLVNAVAPTFLSIRDNGRLLGVARGIVTEGWLGVTAVTVQSDVRRRGVGSALMSALIQWAAAKGAHSAYLQVDAANEPALAMYGQGFTEHHRYHYLTR